MVWTRIGILQLELHCLTKRFLKYISMSVGDWSGLLVVIGALGVKNMITILRATSLNNIFSYI